MLFPRSPLQMTRKQTTSWTMVTALVATLVILSIFANAHARSMGVSSGGQHVKSLSVSGSVTDNEDMPGGLAGERPMDAETSKIVSSLTHSILTSTGNSVQSAKIVPLSYRSQVVAGLNYFVKCAIETPRGETKYVLVRIYRPLPGQGEPTVVAIKDIPHRDTPVSYFQ